MSWTYYSKFANIMEAKAVSIASGRLYGYRDVGLIFKALAV